MHKVGAEVRGSAIVGLLSSCARTRDESSGLRVHDYLLDKKLLWVDVRVGNALLGMYGKCGCIEKARRVFDEMPERSLVSWVSMMHAYGVVKRVEEARKIFDEMPERNAVAWTCMVGVYARVGSFAEALKLFKEMQCASVKPNEATLVSITSICAHMGALELGRWVHSLMGEHGIKLSIRLGTSLIDMYSKCGTLELALMVFHEMPERNVNSWTAMIVGLALHGEGKGAIDLFSHMEGQGLKPNCVAFVGVLSACSHAGLVDEGLHYFELMSSRYHLEPKIEHYGCLVDLLGRAGRLREAREFIESMPFEPNSAVLGALMGACLAHGNLELGEWVGRWLLELEPHHCGRYIVLSNIYASCKRWDEALNVRKMMDERGVYKKPGFSWVELNGVVHQFHVGDKRHPQTKEIYSMLDEINMRLRSKGYVAQTNQILLDIEDEEEMENALIFHSEKLAIASVSSI
ncbi:pentatricopeptide repeat-containing protein At2g29760, chloroplastic-like [Amborella trichopoda]|uniref:pentatricopeptide repeat-containing protein At2g29760, chloroplastic-like n=1 Tax=Amborella trichopoda TaxID=13333 RepID=UPI0009BE3EA3|nr:pentatricopeptide repeat-containing protein At2g29760, chloroplastic-like [Amborella trichopoda]|eukprot:XP_011624162.2 pentatricopeptide repeat-containing protein At2g29760, chloroplastic-like [Amborella trichopoda]